MKYSIVAILLASFLTGSLSKPTGLVLGYQDTLGQYSFGYSAPYQARSEVRSLDGVTRGSYSYVDGAGLVQSTDYTADGQNGFRVAATNLPQAPVAVQETPEVAAARAAHLLEVEKAVRAVEAPQETDSVAIIAKTSEPETAQKETSPPAEPIIEVVAEAEEAASEVQKSEATAEVAAEADAKEEAQKQKAEAEVQQQKGRAVDESPIPQAPVIASAAASLPVPLIPINFDLPTITAYSGRPAGAKADETLPQATPAQGVITPAGTTLKTVPTPQLVALAPQISSASEPAAPASATTSGSAKEFSHYERARAVFAPVAPVNVIPLGYDPTISSFLRYAPFPYITYNIL